MSSVLLVSLVGVVGCGGEAPEPPGAVSPAGTIRRAGASEADVLAMVDRLIASAEHPGLTWGAIPDAAPIVTELYGGESDRLFWFDGADPLPVTDDVVAGIAAAAGEHGLDPADYDSVALAHQWAAIEAGALLPPERALFDTGLTVAVARLIAAVHLGRIDPNSMHWGYEAARKQLDVASGVEELRRGRRLSDLLAGLAPPFAHYTRAQKTLAQYKAMARAGEPGPLPDFAKDRRKVEPGETWEGVPQLATRLRLFGDLPGPADRVEAADGPLRYAGDLPGAVKRFQERHGLEPDGVIGAGTLAALNVPLSQRVRQIELAMERMRWLPTMSDRANVFVNVALFRLWATDPLSDTEPVRMRVVVGKSLSHRTPIFIEQMEYVVFRPYWNPPYSISVKEIVPHARRDPSYFARENLEIVASGADDAPALPATAENLSRVVAGALYIRQKPGPGNSLGLAKFIFPNDENVYMHGTPAPQLFSRARRDFSHGCIRLEDPARLAEWVLRGRPEWTRERIEAAMQGDRPTRVNLEQPLTVVIFYDTVHVNSEGVVFFVDDIYRHDEELDVVLRKGYPYPRTDSNPRSPV